MAEHRYQELIRELEMFLARKAFELEGAEIDVIIHAIELVEDRG